MNSVFDPVDEYSKVTVKGITQPFAAMLFIILLGFFLWVLHFESVGEILKCGHSNCSGR